MPSFLIDHENGVHARRHFDGDFGQVQVHRLGIADEKDQSRALAFFGADGADDVGRGGALIVRPKALCRVWPSAA
jgi:hypothetical protein